MFPQLCNFILPDTRTRDILNDSLALVRHSGGISRLFFQWKITSGPGLGVYVRILKDLRLCFFSGKLHRDQAWGSVFEFCKSVDFVFSADKYIGTRLRAGGGRPNAC